MILIGANIFGSVEPWLWLLPVVYALTSSILPLILWYLALITVAAAIAIGAGESRTRRDTVNSEPAPQ